MPTLIVPARVVPSRWQRWFTRFCWLYLFAVCLVWGLMVFEGDQGWIGTLILFGPRWFLALPLLVYLPLLAWFRSRRQILILSITGIILLFPICRLVVNPLQLTGSSERGAIRLLTCNLGGQSMQSPSWKSFWNQTNPDVMVIQEAPADCIASLPAGWNHAIGPTRVVVASRYPIRKISEIQARELGLNGGAILTRIELPILEFNVLGLHLPTPRAGFEAIKSRWQGGIGELRETVELRHRASKICRNLIASTAEPLFIAGDLNQPDDSRIYREIWNDFGNAFSAAGQGFGYTKRLSWFGIRIDHILYNDVWQCRSCWIGPDVGSDHRPVVADFDLAKQP